jgi:hypothetical protein
VAQSGPRLSQFGSAFGWLLSKDVSSERIAGLFGTRAANVRVIAHRWRMGDRSPTISRPALGTAITSAERRSLGIRLGYDEVVPTPAKKDVLDSLRASVNAVVALHWADYDFPAGVQDLRRLISLVGYPADVRRIHLAGLIHQHIAWFLVHSGACRSAMTEAAIAGNLWRTAYHESPQRLYADEFVRSALIESHAALLMRKPQAALTILEAATDAARQVSAPIGSDHYRQRGVACFQMREDEQAQRHFEQAGRIMERLGEAQHPVSILMTSARHINLLGTPNWDRSQEILRLTEQAFGLGSLEYSMSMHWAAASAFCSGSHEARLRAQEILSSRRPPAAHLGHQTTIARLLALTPDLGLDERLQKAWVRRALYENTSRNS